MDEFLLDEDAKEPAPCAYCHFCSFGSVGKYSFFRKEGKRGEEFLVTREREDGRMGGWEGSFWVGVPPGWLKEGVCAFPKLPVLSC